MKHSNANHKNFETEIEAIESERKSYFKPVSLVEGFASIRKNLILELNNYSLKPAGTSQIPRY